MSIERTAEADDGIEDLRASLAISRHRVALLRDEIAFYRTRAALMRDALLMAHSTIKSMQEDKQHIAQNKVKFVMSVQKHWNRVKMLERPQAGRPRSVSQAALEKSILRAARARVPGIEGVIVECHAGADTNWRVCGIASGNVDADLAKVAVLEAAARFACCVLAVNEGERSPDKPKRRRRQRHGWLKRCFKV